MLSIREQLAVVYCLVDDGLKSEKNGGNWRKSNHNPKGTDAAHNRGCADAKLFWNGDAQKDIFIGESQ